MMRYARLAVSAAFVLAGFSSAQTSTNAQDVVVSEAPGGHTAHSHHGLSFPWSRPQFPRTFSYMYPSSFNTPQHTKYVTPDGRVFWRTTVRGLPVGMPWPSH